jgi:AcrR family transcriptional regulator
MGHDIRKQILQTGKALFNEHGSNAVSTRDIAQAPGISKGNLSYHFKKKEETMEAILLESQNSPRPSAPTTFAEMDALFTKMQQMLRKTH